MLPIQRTSRKSRVLPSVAVQEFTKFPRNTVCIELILALDAKNVLVMVHGVGSKSLADEDTAEGGIILVVCNVPSYI